MLKARTVGIWFSSVLTCCGCQGSSTNARSPLLTTIYVSEKASAAIDTWIHTGPGRRAGNVADTGSMKPALDERYVVIVEKRPFVRLRPGDIVIIEATWSPARVAHRLVQQLPMGWWVTCGDGNRQPDPLMSERDYAGAVVIAAIEKHTGAVKIFDRRTQLVSATAKTSTGIPGELLNSHIVCSRER